MKRTIKLGLMMFALLISGSKTVCAQEAESEVKTTLNKLFDLSKSKGYEKASALIAYDGEDKTRIQKVAFNPTNKEELNQVKRKCKEISALIDLSSKHEFGKYESKKDGTIEKYTIEVKFFSGNQILVKSYTFIKSENEFLLIDSL